MLHHETRSVLDKECGGRNLINSTFRRESGRIFADSEDHKRSTPPSLFISLVNVREHFCTLNEIARKVVSRSKEMLENIFAH